MWNRAILIWCGFFVLAVLNGALREIGIKRLIGEPWAHHLSVLTAILIFGIYAWLTRSYLDLRSSNEAISVGIVWLVLTVLAETFIVGRLLSKHSWDVILANYDILHGNLWPLVVLWVGVLPLLIYRFSQK
jgi:hypothetical protein